MKFLWNLKLKDKQKLEVDGLSQKKNNMMIKRQKLKLDWLLEVFKKH